KSLYSIANGGWLGSGLGKGTFTTVSGKPLIPYVSTDFIYSALAQELGLIGASALLLVFMLFVARGMKAALQVDDGFSKLLAAGGGRSSRGTAGQRHRAGRAVPDQARPDLRRRRAHGARVERPPQARRPDALLPHVPDARIRVAGRRLLDPESLASRYRAPG